MMGHNQQFWWMGLPLIQGYYTIWNNDNHNASKVGFVPHDTSSKLEITTGTTPTTKV